MMSKKILHGGKLETSLFWMPPKPCSENVDNAVLKHQMFSAYTQIKKYDY